MRYYAEAPLRRPWPVILPALLLCLAAVALGVLAPPRYRAAALVLAEWNTGDDASILRRSVDVTARRGQSVRQLVLDPNALARLRHHTGADGRPVAASARDVERLREAVRVQPRGASAFSIECVDGDAPRAARVANFLANDLVERTADEAVGPRSPQLEARLAEARLEMEQRKVALEATGGEVDTQRGDPSEDLLLGQERDEAEKRAVSATLATARARADRLRLLIEGARRPPNAAGEPDTELERLRAELTQLRRRYTEEHPDVERLVARIGRLAGTTATPNAPAPEQELRDVEVEIAALVAKQAELTKPRAKRVRPAADAPAGEAQRQRLTQEHELARQAYEGLVEEGRAAETAARLSRGMVARFQTLREAGVPTTSESFGLPWFAAGGVLVGLLIGLAVSLVAERRDHTVKGPEDLALILPAPLLTTIQIVRARSRRDGG